MSLPTSLYLIPPTQTQALTVAPVQKSLSVTVSPRATLTVAPVEKKLFLAIAPNITIQGGTNEDEAFATGLILGTALC